MRGDMLGHDLWKRRKKKKERWQLGRHAEYCGNGSTDCEIICTVSIPKWTRLVCRTVYHLLSNTVAASLC